MDYSKAFDGYAVPSNIKTISILISKRFAITGICDPMYIANTIAKISGAGDGQGNFTTDTISNHRIVADQLQRAYSSNIVPAEIPELEQILLSAQIDAETAIPRMKAFINRLENEKRRCDPWRIDYLNRVILTIQNNMADITESHDFEVRRIRYSVTQGDAASPFRDGHFIHESGQGWLGIAYISSSIAKTVFIRPDTDHGVVDCNYMMQRIQNMTDDERLALVTR